MTQTLVVVAVVAAVIAALALAARLLLTAVTVRGGSMTPSLNPGDVLLVLRHRRRTRPGRIVVVQRPDPVTGWAAPPAGKGWYVKRVMAVPGDVVPSWVAGEQPERVPPGMLVVRGDHPLSEDSKQWGLCPAEQMYGVVLCRLRAASSDVIPQNG
ncbi:S26 family signal peptidase [Spirillospora sp. NPDC049652]